MRSTFRRAALLVPLLAGSCSRSPSQAPPPAHRAAGEPTEAAVSELSVGVRLMEQFLHADAEKRFAAALQEAPGWLPAQIDLAIAQMNQLEPESAARAEASARAALALAPDEARVHYVLAYVLAERAGRFDEALTHFRAACERAPGDTSAWFQRGRAAEEASRTGDAAALRAEARESYEKALALDPRSPEASYRLGRALLDSGSAEDVARGEALLGDHQRLLAGRPAVQPNYLTRGALALAFPFSPPRAAPAAPGPVALAASAPLPLPVPVPTVADEGVSVPRLRAGVTVADLDGDGRLDVLAPLRDPRTPDIAWWTQSAARAFVPADAIGRPGRACSTAAPGDLDGDGDLDLVITCSTGNVVLLRDEGTWRDATPREMAFPSVAGARCTLVDFDHDGDLDVHAVLPLSEAGAGGWAADSLLFQNDGKAGFTQVASTVGLLGPFASELALWTDADGDNVIDVVTLVSGGGLALLHHDREGPFRAVALPIDVPRPAAGPPTLDLESLDVDGDADQDLVALVSGSLTVLVNESEPGAPAYRAVPFGPPPAAATALAVADLDLDGARELLMLAPTEALGTSRSELLSAAGLALPVRLVGAEGLDPEVLAPADVDGDGAVDVVARLQTGEPVVLWTTPPAGATWTRLALAGRAARSNLQGLGARLTMDAGTSRQSFERRAARGLGSHVVSPEAVGLGGRSRLDGVTVLWPSGIQQGEADLAAGAEHAVVELDRQPSSCPMLYGWDGSSFRFLTDCFDTAPLGLWVAPGVHWAGDPDEVLRLRDGWVAPIDGVLNLSIAEFLNETLLADRVGLLAVDHEASRRVVVDEAVRLAAAPPPFTAWLVGAPAPVSATQDGADVSEALRDQDGRVAGYVRPLPWIGLAEAHSLELQPPGRDGLLVLTGSLNFSNSAGLFGAAQAGVRAQPARLEVFERGSWKDVVTDCGVPAGFHKDVVIDLRTLPLPARPRLRVTTNLQVSWDRAAFYADAAPAAESSVREVPLLRAEKRWLGIPREVRGPENRWRSFPREGLEGASEWVRQDGPSTPDGDVRAEVSAGDDRVAFVRPGEELLVAFDDAALGAPGTGLVRTHVLSTRGWVKDATPQTAMARSVMPLPRPGAQTYP